MKDSDANDNRLPNKQAAPTVTARYSVGLESTPVPVPRRWRRVRRVASWMGGVLAILTAVGTAAVVARQNRTFDAPTVDNIHASSDPAVIARGHYLVNGPGHCAECHGDPARQAERAAGNEIPLSGGVEFHLPVGVFRVPNLTSDAETGVGRMTDGEIARLLRHGVRPDGTAVLPFMPFANLADDDLTAVISYIRSLPPVRHAVRPHSVNVLGSIVKAFVITPKGPTAPVAAIVPPSATPEYGRYLAHNVANCVGCHTKVDMRTGNFVGPLFGGGNVIESAADPEKKFVTPNLTPDARWGWIASWPEEVFVARIKQGLVRAGSPMPWNAFKNMNDGDLRALYRYLRTVAPATGGPDPSQEGSVVVVARN